MKRKHAALSVDVEQLKHLYQYLHTCSEEEALEIFQRIRSNPDPAAVHKLIQDGDALRKESSTHGNTTIVPRQADVEPNASLSDLIKSGARPRKSVSDHATAQAVLQSMDSRLEYEITVSHPHMYPQAREEINATILPSANDIELACLGLTKPPYSQYRTDPREIMGPSRPPEYIDSRLRRLDMSHWSTVQVSNIWAAQAISLYLATDHAVATLIDAELFLRDLVEERTEFCSPLLVSSLMFWAFVSTVGHMSRSAALLTRYSKACPNSTEARACLATLFSTKHGRF